MRDQGLIMGAVLGAALLLPVPGSAQDLTMPPSMTQSPTMPMPDSSEPPPATSPAPANPQTQPPEKVENTAATQAKKSVKTAAAKAKLRPATAEAGATATETAPVAKPKGAAKSRMAKYGARGPRDIVATIYRVSAGANGNYDGPSAFDDAKIRELYFSNDLNAALAASEAKSSATSVVNFDPITNSEGPDVQDLHIALESATSDRASVAAKFASTNESSIVHYDFVKEGKAWKLDNMRGEIVGQDGQWSLREILKNSLQRS
jgi:hypothetical protein